MSATPKSLSRRQFAHTAMIGAATGALVAAAKTTHADEKPADKAVRAQRPDEEADKSPVHPADLLLDVIRQQYAHPRLMPAAQAEIRRDLRSDLIRSKILSRFPLKNADEPAFVFAAYRSEG